MWADVGQDAQWACFKLGTRKDKELSGAKTIRVSLHWSWPRMPERITLGVQEGLPNKKPKDPGHKW